MDRRAFMGGLALGTLAAPLAALAEAARKYRIGVLNVGGTTSDMIGPQSRVPAVNALLRGLRELGYVYGDQFVTEPRSGEGRPERYPPLAAELVRLQVDVIVAAGPTLSALKQATSTIPIVMGGAEDPVGDRLVQSLGRPGGNFTGLSNQSVETTGKRLELLKQLVPGAALVATLWDRASIRTWHAAEAAARDRGWKLLSLEVRDAADLEEAIRKATSARAGALLALGGLAFSQARRVAELISCQPSASRHVFLPAAGGGRRAHLVWRGHRRDLAAHRGLRRQDPQGREALRPARRGAHQVRARHQPEDRQSPRPDDSAGAAAAGGSGDRVMRRRGVLSGVLALAAAVAAVGCSSGVVPAVSPTSAQTECGRTPGAAGVWRPQLNYCEY